MKPAFITPFLLSKLDSISQNADPSNAVGGFAKKIPSMPPSFAENLKSSRLNYNNGIDIDGGEDKYVPSKIDPANFANSNSPAQEVEEVREVSSLKEKIKSGTSPEAYKYEGANPQLNFGNGDNVAHYIARQFDDIEGTDKGFLDYYATVRQFATSGGDLSKKNDDGLTPAELVKTMASNSTGTMAHYMDSLQKEQMSHFAEIGEYVYSGPQKYASYDSPTSQMLNMVSQPYDKLSDIAKDRIPKLIESGADLNATRSEIITKERYSEPEQGNDSSLAELAKQNWGDKKAQQLVEMSDSVKKIGDFVEENIDDDFFKLKKPINIKKASPEKQEEMLSRLLVHKGLNELYQQLDSSVEKFGTDDEKSKQEGLKR